MVTSGWEDCSWDPSYTYLSNTDSLIERFDNVLIATEAKTTLTFPRQPEWYKNSRGAQALIAVYVYNAPTFLYSNRSFKVFVENLDRDKIFTFPFAGRIGFDHITHGTHQDFIHSSAVFELNSTTSSVVESSGTHSKSLVFSEHDNIFLDMIALCLLGKGSSVSQNIKNVTSSFVKGFDAEGAPVYQEVRIFGPSQGAMIWKELGLPDGDDNADYADWTSDDSDDESKKSRISHSNSTIYLVV